MKFHLWKRKSPRPASAQPAKPARAAAIRKSKRRKIVAMEIKRLAVNGLDAGLSVAEVSEPFRRVAVAQEVPWGWREGVDHTGHESRCPQDLPCPGAAHRANAEG